MTQETKDNIEAYTILTIFIGFILLIPFTIYLHFFGPCSWYKFGTLKDTPLRCLKILNSPTPAL